MRTPEEIEKIRAYVQTNSKTWYMGNKRQWNCTVQYISEIAFTKEDAIERMIKRITDSDFLFSFLKIK